MMSAKDLVRFLTVNINLITLLEKLNIVKN